MGEAGFMFHWLSLPIEGAHSIQWLESCWDQKILDTALKRKNPSLFVNEMLIHFFK
jgi:hypothetical protein